MFHFNAFLVLEEFIRRCFFQNHLITFLNDEKRLDFQLNWRRQRGFGTSPIHAYQVITIEGEPWLNSPMWVSLFVVKGISLRKIITEKMNQLVENIIIEVQMQTFENMRKRMLLIVAGEVDKEDIWTVRRRQSYYLLFEKFLLANFTRSIRMSDEFRVIFT